MKDGYWTFEEWAQATSNKIASASVTIADEENRFAYIHVQTTGAIMKALRHGRSGLQDNDPVTP